MIKGKKVVSIIPSRMTSSRLPGKVLMDLAGRPALQRVIERVRASKLLDDIVIATTENETDQPIIELCEKLNCNYFRGSENNVLERILGAAKAFKADVICELTSDCPLIFWGHIDHLIDLHMQNYPYYDMTTNILTRTFPRGFDLRIVNIEALEKSYKEIDNQIDFEHALTWIYLNPKGKQNYTCLNWSAPAGQNRPDIEVTLDTPEDLELLNWIFSYESQGYNMELTCQNVINLLDTYPHMLERVKKIQRKDYFAELEEAYKIIKAEEDIKAGRTRSLKDILQDKGAKKQNEKVQRADNRSRRAGSVSGRAGKSKPK